MATKTAKRKTSKSKTTTSRRKATPQRVVISDSKQASQIFRNYMKSTKTSQTGYEGQTVPGSRARWSTVQQVANWYNGENNADLDMGWYGRSLNASSGITSQMISIDGKQRRVFRLGN